MNLKSFRKDVRTVPQTLIGGQLAFKKAGHYPHNACCEPDLKHVQRFAKGGRNDEIF